jgi:hypothetical protein
MRTCVKLLCLLGFGTQLLTAPTLVLAADLAVTPTKKASRVIQRQRLRVVRDYDGTPIVLRRARPVAVRTYDGAIAFNHHLYEAIALIHPTPGRYLNGQPVQPTNRILYARRRLTLVD